MREEYVYVAVDETGNLGMSLKGERYYTVVACVVNDRKRFEDATRRLGFLKRSSSTHTSTYVRKYWSMQHQLSPTYTMFVITRRKRH